MAESSTNADLDAMQAALEQIYRETTDERSRETARAAIRIANNVDLDDYLHEEMLFQVEREIADLITQMAESVDGKNAVLVALASISVLLIASREIKDFHYLSMIQSTLKKAMPEVGEMILRNTQ